MNASPHPYADLTPDRVLDALDSVGLRGDGRLLALGSYENRVYQIGIEDAAPVVAKFYRPGRWSDEAIVEEHGFVAELAAREIPVVAPLAARRGHAARIRRLPLRRLSAMRRPRAGARQPGDAGMDGPLPRTHPRGRRAGAVPAPAGARHRDVRRRAARLAARARLHSAGPADALAQHRRRRRWTARGAAFERAGDVRTLRLHGDCHAGNVLWIEHGATRGPHFVDFDDARMGPAVQDLWMLLSGDRAEMTRQLDDVLSGYEDFYDVRSARAPPGRGAAHAAPAPLFGLARRSAGTIPRFPRRSRGSTPSATGRTASSSCASRSR